MLNPGIGIWIGEMLCEVLTDEDIERIVCESRVIRSNV